jgi:hypothetical protein
MREISGAFGHALLKSEKTGSSVSLSLYVSFDTGDCAHIRAGFGDEPMGLVAAAQVIGGGVGLHLTANWSLHSGMEISNFVWYVSSVH